MIASSLYTNVPCTHIIATHAIVAVVAFVAGVLIGRAFKRCNRTMSPTVLRPDLESTSPLPDSAEPGSVTPAIGQSDVKGLLADIENLDFRDFVNELVNEFGSDGDETTRALAMVDAYDGISTKLGILSMHDRNVAQNVLRFVKSDLGRHGFELISDEAWDAKRQKAVAVRYDETVVGIRFVRSEASGLLRGDKVIRKQEVTVVTNKTSKEQR